MISPVHHLSTLFPNKQRHFSSEVFLKAEVLSLHNLP